jgi:hypothetical protein
MSPPSSGSKNKPNKKPAWKQVLSKLCCIPLQSFNANVMGWGGGAYCRHLGYSDSTIEAKRLPAIHEDILIDFGREVFMAVTTRSILLLVSCLTYCSTPKMETICSSEMSGSLRTTSQIQCGTLEISRYCCYCICSMMDIGRVLWKQVRGLPWQLYSQVKFNEIFIRDISCQKKRTRPLTDVCRYLVCYRHHLRKHRA